MLKFFRKYNKIILVIGGAFLMVSFLLMDSIGRLGGSLGLSAPYAKVDGQTIDNGQFRESVRELEFVRRIAPEILSLIGIDGQNLSEHWFLLTYEAERAGLVGGPGDGGAEFIETAATLIADREARLFAQQAAMFGQNAASFIEQQRSLAYQSARERMVSRRDIELQRGQPVRVVDLALAKMRAVIRLLESQPGIDTLSRPEALAYASDLFDVAIVRAGVIPPNIREVSIGDPSDDEIAAHFEQYRDQRPADNELSIGYLLEPAVKIEFLSIETRPIINEMRVDEIEVNKYWRNNKTRFGEDWSAAKESATNSYKAERASEILDRSVRIVQREQRRVSRNLERDGGYLALPSDWSSTKLSLEVLMGTIQQELSAEFGFQLPMPGVTKPVANFLDARALSGLRGIGTSAWNLNDNVRVPFTDLMMNVRSLGGNEAFGLQQDILFGPLRSGGGVYFVRVTDSRDEGPPETLDATLRQRVVADIRAVKVFEDLKANAEAYRTQLVNAGFEPGFAEIAPGAMIQDMEVTRLGVAQPGRTALIQRFDTESIRDAIMDRVLSWDPYTDVPAEISLDERVMVLPLSSELALLCVQVTTRRPLTYEQLHANTPSIRAVAMNDRADAAALLPFSLEALKSRLGVEFLDRSGDERTESEDDGTEAESPEA